MAKAKVAPKSANVLEADAPEALVRKLDEYALKAKALGWFTTKHYTNSHRGYIFGTLHARQYKTEHVWETVFMSWSFSGLAKYGQQLRFSHAWRALVLQGVNSIEDGSDSSSVGSRIDFRNIRDSMLWLKDHGPTSQRRHSTSSQRTEFELAILTTSATSTNNKEKQPTMVTKSAGATKKASTAKKASPTKAAASKKAAPATATKAEEVAARKEAREAELTDLRKRIVELRDKQDKSWTEISSTVGLSVNLVVIRYNEAKVKAENPTPAKVKSAREKDMLSWDQIRVRFGFKTKAAAQKMYTEAGGNLSFQVGRGGRFIDGGGAKANGAAKKSAASAKKAAATSAAKAAKPIFDGTEDSDDIRKRIGGKKITVAPQTPSGAVREFNVPKDGIKVGKSPKTGDRVVQFNDDGNRTVAVTSIVKVGR